MLGLYIHFPYCLRLCPYCDFAVTVTRSIPEERYARAVVRELDARLAQEPKWREEPLGSIYLGGGTPSLWDVRWVSELLDATRKRLSLTPSVEVTLEANPERLSEQQLAGYRRSGINRLSLGLQSFHTPTLRALGRAHDGTMARSAFALARRAGFDNVSVDLIHAVHGQSLQESLDDAREAAALGPEHVSAYALTLDPDVLAIDVVLAQRVRKGEVLLPEEELAASMADGVCEILEGAGLGQYEISNFAQPGRASTHNQLYWRGEDYLALGCGAVGFRREGTSGFRYTNLRRAETYLAAVEGEVLPEADRETLDARMLAKERVLTGLRLSEGLDLTALDGVGGEKLFPEGEVARLEAGGLLERAPGRIRLTQRGRMLHSSVAARLL